MGVLTDAGQAGPEWLTEVLRRAGALGDERVLAVEPRPNDAFNSATTHLALGYDRDRPAGPRKLLLKLNRDSWGEAEVGLYRLAMPLDGALPTLVRCYDAAYDPATGASHCLLLDVSDTHAPPLTRERVLALDGVPRPEQLDAVVDALADFHAYWWEHPGFGTGVLLPPSSLRDAPARAERIRQRGEQFARFVDAVGGTVEPAVLRLCERALADLPALWEDRYGRRFGDRRGLTVVNGDCYFTQFLCPRAPGPDPTYLVDFQEASVHLPAEDLVFMLATFWTREQRREGDREMRALRRYLSRLQERGVNGYGRDQLLDDYRVSIVYMLFRTIWDQTNGSSESYWRPKLACVTASFQDHDCAGLTIR
ncbi:MAG TPA: hypothetical protein VGM69_17945 [Chloroflexota bacterium]